MFSMKLFLAQSTATHNKVTATKGKETSTRLVKTIKAVVQTSHNSATATKTAAASLKSATATKSPKKAPKRAPLDLAQFKVTEHKLGVMEHELAHATESAVEQRQAITTACYGVLWHPYISRVSVVRRDGEEAD